MNWLQLALLSASFAGLVAIFGKLGMKDVDAATATTARALVMLCALALLTAAQGKLEQLTRFSMQAWLYIGLAGLAGAASWLCYFQALKVGQASRVAPVDRLSTVITIALSVIFLGETITWKLGLGALLIIGGSILVAL